MADEGQPVWYADATSLFSHRVQNTSRSVDRLPKGAHRVFALGRTILATIQNFVAAPPRGPEHDIKALEFVALRLPCVCVDTAFRPTEELVQLRVHGDHLARYRSNVGRSCAMREDVDEQAVGVLWIGHVDTPEEHRCDYA
jgi:hypothetical protein